MALATPVGYLYEPEIPAETDILRKDFYKYPSIADSLDFPPHFFDARGSSKKIDLVAAAMKSTTPFPLRT